MRQDRPVQARQLWHSSDFRDAGMRRPSRKRKPSQVFLTPAGGRAGEPTLGGRSMTFKQDAQHATQRLGSAPEQLVAYGEGAQVV